MATLSDLRTAPIEVAAKLLGDNLGYFDDNSPDWHRLRNEPGAIGGSDVGILLGLSSFVSPYALWAKKKGLIPDQETSDAMEWGHRLEPAIAQKFAEKRPGITFVNCGTWASRENSLHRANPDGLYLTPTGELQLLEVKTARDETFWKDEDGVLTVPPSYRAQVQWYLYVLGLKTATVSVLFGGSRYHEFAVEGSEFEQELAVNEANKFIELLLSDVTPDLTAPFTATQEALRYQHPEIIQESEVELGETGQAYLDHLAELEAAQAKVDQAKAQVIQLMGNARRGLIYDQWLITRQARKGGIPYLVNRK
jgi:putative phage-type endonuclease